MKEELMLIQLDRKYLDQLSQYRQEFLDANDELDGCGPLQRFEDMDVYYNWCQSLLQKETLPANMVVCTQFMCIRKNDDRLVGMIQVRHYFNEYLEKYAGHIGYSVRCDERKKGYASWMLENVKPFCTEIGLKKIMVCCVDNNEGSRRTILNNGGVYEKTVYFDRADVNLERYWINLEG